MMNNSVSKRHFSASVQNICILANSRQADLIGSRIIQNLRRVSGDQISTSGYGGAWMKKEGFEPTLDFDVGIFADKTFSTYRKTKTHKDYFFRWNPFNMVNKHFTRQTDQAYDLIMENDILKRVHQTRPSLILNIDNEYMTFLLMEQMRNYYGSGRISMPKRHYVNRFVKDLRPWSEEYIDYMHYTTPLTTGLGGGYKFPGEYIGQYGVYEAVRHIYSRSQALSSLVSEDGSELHVSQRYFATDLEKGIENVRSEFRQKHQIDDDTHVIFYAPGNEQNEAQFTAETARKGIKEFLLKYSAPTSLSAKALPLNKFATVISLHSGSEGEKWIREHMKEQEWHGRVIIVSSDNDEHLDAMCASDAGIIHNGQMVSSAVACHLPTMNLFDMRMHHQWYHDLYNRWWNDMNIVANKNIYPEMIGGEAWYGKVADTLGEWYLKPDTRYNFIRQWDGFLQEGMSYKEIDRSKVRTRDIILSDGNAYNIYQDPFSLAARKIWDDMQAYEMKGQRAENSLEATRIRVQTQ